MTHFSRDGFQALLVKIGHEPSGSTACRFACFSTAMSRQRYGELYECEAGTDEITRNLATQTCGRRDDTAPQRMDRNA